MDFKFSSQGLLVSCFALKFKKFLLFLQSLNDSDLLFNISCFLDVRDLIALISTCKKLYCLKENIIIEVRILKQKIKYLENPKEIFNSLSFLSPCNYQSLSFHKQDEKQIQKNEENFFRILPDYKKVRDFLSKRKQSNLKVKPQPEKTLQTKIIYQPKIQKIERPNIAESGISQKMKFPKKPLTKSRKQIDYVQKFRENYKKKKQFEHKRNIMKLQQLHRKESQMIKIKIIQTPFRKIPIIEIRDGDRIKVTPVKDSFQQSALKFLNRIKVILGLPTYY